MNKTIFALLSAAAFLTAPAFAQDARVVTVNPPAGALPALNNKPTGAYDASKVETKLNVEIKDGVNKVHFIRDNNDPFVVTKAYVLKHADPYTMRGILNHVVKGTTIDGSPVAVDAIRYVGGKGVILISAEEYRFKKNGNNTGFDELVATFDKPKMAFSSGSVEMIYYPKYNKASTLLDMLVESKIGLSAPDGVEYAEHKDNLQMPDNNGTLVDEDLNALLLSVNRWDLAIVKDFLKKLDTPTNQVRVTYKLMEVYAENDQKIGVDFQAWKNNDGLDLFAIGGRFNNNWWTNGRLTPNNGFTNASFYNFNPKWSTKYLDFLTTNGKARIVSSGTVLVADGKKTVLELKSGAMVAVSEPEEGENLIKNENEKMPKGRPGKYYDREYQKRIPEEVQGKPADYTAIDHKVAQGQRQTITAAAAGKGGNSFYLTIAPQGAGIKGAAAKVKIKMESDSIIGWTSDGAPRMSNSSYKAVIQIGSNKKDFVIGGINKTTVTRGVNGIPFLKDLPVLGWLFSTETDTVKKSQYVLIASVEKASVSDKVQKTIKDEIIKIQNNVNEMAKCPTKALGYQQLILDKEAK